MASHDPCLDLIFLFSAQAIKSYCDRQYRVHFPTGYMRWTKIEHLALAPVHMKEKGPEPVFLCWAEK